MFLNKLAEHLAHSAPCASCFDGFDRGDDDRFAGLPEDDELDAFADTFVGPLPAVALPEDFDLWMVPF